MKFYVEYLQRQTHATKQHDAHFRKYLSGIHLSRSRWANKCGVPSRKYASYKVQEAETCDDDPITRRHHPPQRQPHGDTTHHNELQLWRSRITLDRRAMLPQRLYIGSKTLQKEGLTFTNLQARRMIPIFWDANLEMAILYMSHKEFSVVVHDKLVISNQRVGNVRWPSSCFY